MVKPVKEPTFYLYEERLGRRNQVLIIGVRGNTHKFKPDKPIQIYGLQFIYNEKGEAVCGANYYYRRLKQWPMIREEYEDKVGRICEMISWRTDDFSVFNEIGLINWHRDGDTLKVITLEELLTSEHPYARIFGAKVATDGYSKTLSDYFQRIRESAVQARNKANKARYG